MSMIIAKIMTTTIVEPDSPMSVFRVWFMSRPPRERPGPHA